MTLVLSPAKYKNGARTCKTIASNLKIKQRCSIESAKTLLAALRLARGHLAALNARFAATTCCAKHLREFLVFLQLLSNNSFRGRDCDSDSDWESLLHDGNWRNSKMRFHAFQMGFFFYFLFTLTFVVPLKVNCMHFCTKLNIIELILCRSIFAFIWY